MLVEDLLDDACAEDEGEASFEASEDARERFLDMVAEVSGTESERLWPALAWLDVRR